MTVSFDRKIDDDDDDNVVACVALTGKGAMDIDIETHRTVANNGCPIPLGITAHARAHTQYLMTRRRRC